MNEGRRLSILPGLRARVVRVARPVADYVTQRKMAWGVSSTPPTLVERTPIPANTRTIADAVASFVC
jgi:hypothetical protein